MNLSDLDAAAPAAVAALAGLDPTPDLRIRQRGLYLSPCPCCSATRAHTKSRTDKRGAVHLRDGWACYACGETGSRADLLALTRHGRKWADLTRDERDQVLGAPAPLPQPLPPPPPRLDAETWARIAALCVSPRYDERMDRRGARILERARSWFERRRLHPAGDLLVIVGEPDPEIPALWTAPTDDRPPIWLPDLGASLLLPCHDERGEVAGARLRNIRPDARVKEQALRGYEARGLAYLPRGLRERLKAGEPPGRPVALAEGKPDQLALGYAWRGQAWVVGYYEGSLSGMWTQRIGVDVHVHQEDEPDQHGRRKSDTYRAQARERWPEVVELGVSRLYERAGVPWREGMDAADLAGAIPGFQES